MFGICLLAEDCPSLMRYIPIQKLTGIMKYFCLLYSDKCSYSVFVMKYPVYDLELLTFRLPVRLLNSLSDYHTVRLYQLPARLSDNPVRLLPHVRSLVSFLMRLSHLFNYNTLSENHLLSENLHLSDWLPPLSDYQIHVRLPIPVRWPGRQTTNSP